MIEHPTLFDQPAADEALARDVTSPRPGAARATDPTTSRKAARNVKPRTGSQRAKVLLVFAEVGDHGLTGDDLAARLGDRNGSSWRSRMAELRDLYDPPLIERTGTTRATRSGEEGDVHAVTEAGRRLAGVLEDEAFAEAG